MQKCISRPCKCYVRCGDAVPVLRLRRKRRGAGGSTTTTGDSGMTKHTLRYCSYYYDGEDHFVCCYYLAGVGMCLLARIQARRTTSPPPPPWCRQYGRPSSYPHAGLRPVSSRLRIRPGLLVDFEPTKHVPEWWKIEESHRIAIVACCHYVKRGCLPLEMF